MRRRGRGPLYLQHFGLREAPFQIGPSARFLVDLPCHIDAQNVVRVALHGGASLVKVVGEVGTGKTLLAWTLARSLRRSRAVAVLSDPGESPDALRAALAEAFGAPAPAALRGFELVQHLRTTLEALRRGRRPTLAFVDEAQTASDETLEALRLLTNPGVGENPALQVVLLGQPELDVRLRAPSLRQIRQRIAFSCRLAPMTRPALAAYVARRLARAGHAGAAPFTRPALAALHRASGGVPRLVNVVCDKALLSAYGRGDARVGWRHVRRAVADTDGIRWSAGVFAR